MNRELLMINYLKVRSEISFQFKCNIFVTLKIIFNSQMTAGIKSVSHLQNIVEKCIILVVRISQFCFEIFKIINIIFPEFQNMPRKRNWSWFHSFTGWIGTYLFIIALVTNTDTKEVIFRNHTSAHIHISRRRASRRQIARDTHCSDDSGLVSGFACPDVIYMLNRAGA